MSTQLPRPRVVVAADNAAGRSHIASDTLAQPGRTVPERPGYSVTNVWALFEAPARIADPCRVAEYSGLAPPPSGNVLRIIDYPPEPADPADRKKMFDALFTKMFATGHERASSSVHPGMHRTDSIDYVLVLAGEIYAVMEEGETLLRAGDVLIQCGTVHAWSNRSSEMARLAFVLIDGKRG